MCISGNFNDTSWIFAEKLYIIIIIQVPNFEQQLLFANICSNAFSE